MFQAGVLISSLTIVTYQDNLLYDRNNSFILATVRQRDDPELQHLFYKLSLVLTRKTTKN